MSKSPYSLEEDINHVLQTGDGWTPEIADWMVEDIRATIAKQMDALKETPDKYKGQNLRLSSIGQPCARKLYYEYNWDGEVIPLASSDKAKFMFGDMIESFLLALAMASGHKVEGMQDSVWVEGVEGHRDAVIDGMTFDVKSASTHSFSKFRDDTLRENDGFGYISQLSSYVAAAQDDPLVTDKTHGGFLAFDKQHGHVTVSIYDFTNELENKVEEIKSRKAMVDKPEPPAKLENVETPFGKSGNMKLGFPCNYCWAKKLCFPEVRTFLYSNGPVHLTKVVREPQGTVLEVS